MHAANFDFNAYLTRIAFSGKVESLQADIATVSQLMQLQMGTIPFENLDVQAKKIVSLVPEEIVDKILYRQRGGYCYEINGLFAMVLQHLDIPYQLVACRPMNYPVRRPKTHMALVITLHERHWLVDLGFGAYGIRQPLALDDLNTSVTQGVGEYLLTKTGEEYLLQTKLQDQWKPQYSFDLYRPEWIDFSPVNYLNSTHPDSIFVQQLFVVKQTENGRIVLLGHQYRVHEQGEMRETLLSDEERTSILDEVFGLKWN